jgi:lipoprotein-anchoring transpeptidase ErfK/SrfK
MAPDGIVGPRVVGALTGRIVVDLSECRLYLYKDGKLVKTYSVAVGQPAYPTPTGDYYIVTMVKNPTWIPPDSPWARGLEPIPPGPGNPVGTRWIGTSARGVGIHGTPADYSIGTHASHGCIRMHMWDVEDLFGRIAVGVPVTIRP